MLWVPLVSRTGDRNRHSRHPSSFASECLHLLAQLAGEVVVESAFGYTGLLADGSDAGGVIAVAGKALLGCFQDPLSRFLGSPLRAHSSPFRFEWWGRGESPFTPALSPVERGNTYRPVGIYFTNIDLSCQTGTGPMQMGYEAAVLPDFGGRRGRREGRLFGSWAWRQISLNSSRVRVRLGGGIRGQPSSRHDR